MGGKGKLKEILYQVFPPDVNRFALHCGGSGAVLLGLSPKAGRLDVYNDFDSELTNLFLCVRDRLLALTEELKIFPILTHIVAADTDIDLDTLEKLRGRCVQDARRTNGEISFQDILRFQKGL